MVEITCEEDGSLGDVYSSVPFKFEDDYTKRISLAKFLSDNKGSSYTAKTLAKECGYPEGGTQVELRKAVTCLIELDCMPVISTSFGFMWPTSKRQLLHYVEGLERRKMGLQRRIDSVRKVYEGLK